MKKWLTSTAVAVLLLSACGSGSGAGGSGALSESECNEVAQRQIDVALAAMPDPDKAGVHEFMQQAKAYAAQECIAGESWTRADYQCAQAATTNEAYIACLQVVLDRDG
jgi:hypothetical protein